MAAWVFVGLVAAAFVAVLLAGSGVLPHPGTPPAEFVFWPLFPIGFLLAFLAIRILWWPLGWCGWGWRAGAYGALGRAHAILEERYARGEISREELRSMRRELD